jgi:hypothetical protein
MEGSEMSSSTCPEGHSSFLLVYRVSIGKGKRVGKRGRRREVDVGRYEISIGSSILTIITITLSMKLVEG